MNDIEPVVSENSRVRSFGFRSLTLLLLLVCGWCMWRSHHQLHTEEQPLVGFWSYQGSNPWADSWTTSSSASASCWVQFRDNSTLRFPTGEMSQSDQVVWHVHHGRLNCSIVHPIFVTDRLLDLLHIRRRHLLMREIYLSSWDRKIVWLNENSFQMGIVKHDTQEYVMTRMQHPPSSRKIAD